MTKKVKIPNKETKTAKIDLRVTPRQKALWKQLAESNKVSLTSLIEYALDVISHN